jgi:hypothetical protein
MSIREQGVVVQHSPLGHEAPFTVTSGADVPLPGLPPLDRIRRVLIYTTEPLLWNDAGDSPVVAGMYLPGDAFLVYDATGAGDLLLRAVDLDAQVRISYHGI